MTCGCPDNPALDWACRTARPVISVFILDDDQPGIRPSGGASRWWLHGSLDALRTALEAADRKTPHRVFTSFWRRCLREGFDDPSGGPSALPAPAAWPASDELDDWRLRCSTPDWAAGLRTAWRPGEAGARKRLDTFLAEGLGGYREHRDLPGATGTSRLSPHLHFGEIGPRQIAAALETLARGPGPDAFLRELGWREFSHHLLFHNPDMAGANLRSEFDRMPWRDDPDALRRWQRGLTGYPLVDAGMRELWTTGWMHNRVRMVTASFLTKHLLLDWRLGESWFWDTLVDADRANNSASWQWVAGCGADAAPYVRVFIPLPSRAGSIREGAICGSGCPRWGACRTTCCTRPGRRRRRRWMQPACDSVRTTRIPWSTTPPPASGHWKPLAATSPCRPGSDGLDRCSRGNPYSGRRQ